MSSKKRFKFVACIFGEVGGGLNESWTSTEWRKIVAFNFKYRHDAICIRRFKKKVSVEPGPLGCTCGQFIPMVRLRSAHGKLSVSDLCRLFIQNALCGTVNVALSL
jgi:hypothetical protein